MLQFIARQEMTEMERSGIEVALVLAVIRCSAKRKAQSACIEGAFVMRAVS